MIRPRLLLVVLSALAAAPAASASTITVTATADGGPSCTLRAAIAAADSPGLVRSPCRRVGGGADVILVPSGTFRLTSGTELPVTGNLTIAGAGVLETTISGDGLTRIFDVAPGASLSVRDLALTQGQTSTSSTFSSGAGARGNDGGAILNAGVLRLADMQITDSQAGTGATGAGVIGGDGGDGGAIYNTGLLTLDGITLTGNSAGSGGTGGSGSSPDNPVFLGGGTGGNGGAVANAGGSVTVSASTFAADLAGTGGEGGPGAPLSGAVAGGFGGDGGDGGGIWSSGGAVSITNSTFTADSAGVAGAGGFDAAGGTGGRGGALAAAGPASVTLLSDTLAADQAGVGGGIYAPAPPPGSLSNPYGPAVVTVEDSLLASNPGGNCAGGGVVDSGSNLGFGDKTCPVGFRPGDPRLGALQDNGGPTYTMALASHSAALSGAPLAGCPATDQRGVRRSGGCDIGAWQFARPRIQLGSTRPLSSTSELLLPLLDVNDGTGSLRISYGSGRVLALAQTFALPAGVAPVHLPVVLRKLKPLTRYRYAMVITTPEGFARSWLGAFTTSASPQISSLEVSRGKVRYRDSRRATTRLELLRCARKLHGRCGAYVRVQRLSHHDASGPNLVRLHSLRAGAYELLATPTFRGLAGRTITVRFSVG